MLTVSCSTRDAVGVISGSLTDMARSLHLSTIEQEMATSGLNFVSGIGAVLVSGNIMDKFGRRPTLLVASLLLLLGSAIVALAPSFAVLLLGRALQGLGSGTGWAACTVYITEVAPADWPKSITRPLSPPNAWMWLRTHRSALR